MTRIALHGAAPKQEFAELAAQLGAPARIGGTHDHHHACPSCGSTNNLHLWVDQEGLGAYCFGCKVGIPQIREALALGTWTPPKTPPKTNGKDPGRVVSRQSWSIKDAAGKAVAIHTRLDLDDGDKAFAWTFVGKTKVPAEDVPLYGSEKVAGYDRAKALVLVEGEKACDRLRAEGYQCVALAAGASVPPTAVVLAVLAGFDAILWPDNDVPGQAVMQYIAGAIAGKASSISVVQPWKGAAPKDDAVDFLESHTVDECDSLLWAAQPAQTAPKASKHLPPRLPAEFWQERTYLAHVRDAAFARFLAPDLLLGAVLARVAAMTNHSIGLPAPVGSEKALNLFVASVGSSGLGKSSSFSLAERLLPADPSDLKVIPGGSGEGLVDAYFGLVPDLVNPKTQVYKQVRHNVLAYVDEVQGAFQRGGRSGSTFWSSTRELFSGGNTGQGNASKERNRVLYEGSYALGLVVNVQPELAGPLFEDGMAGTPQRFVYLAAQDPSIPDDPPRWPGPLRISKPTLSKPALLSPWPHLLALESSVAAEIEAAHKAIQRGAPLAHPLDGQRNLVRFKVAGLLSLMDGRAGVTDDDWRLAGTVLDTSDAVRAWTIDRTRVVDAKREQTWSKRLALRHAQATVTADTALEAERQRRARTRIVEMVTKRPGITRNELMTYPRSDLRTLWRDELDSLVEAGQVEVRPEPGQGNDKTELHPGAKP